VVDADFKVQNTPCRTRANVQKQCIQTYGKQ